MLPLRSGAAAEDIRAVGRAGLGGPVTERQRLGCGRQDRGRGCREAPRPPRGGPCEIAAVHGEVGRRSANVQAGGPVRESDLRMVITGQDRGRAAPRPPQGLAVRDSSRPLRSGAAAADAWTVGPRPAMKRQRHGDGNRDLCRAAPPPAWGRAARGSGRPRRSGTAAADGVALSIVSESSHWQLCAQPQAAEPRASRTGPNPSPASMSSADAMERYVRSVTILTSSPEEVSDEQLLVSEAASRPPCSLSLNRPWQLRAAAEVHP